MAKTPEKIVDRQVDKIKGDYHAGQTNPDRFLEQVKLKAERREKHRGVREFTEQMDLSAQDNHMKYERPQFAVVTATEAYREGYDKIDWDDNNTSERDG